MRKGFFVLTLSAMLFALCTSAEAQQANTIPRVGHLSGTGDAKNPEISVRAFRQGLREVGYIEGKNILVEYRYAQGKLDRAPALVAELLQSKVDVLVASFLPGIRAAKQATKTIPVVFVTGVDPVAAGIVDSLARPGANITGLTTLARDRINHTAECAGESGQSHSLRHSREDKRITACK